MTAELVEPTTHLYDAWLDARDDWGPGLHEDGFGLHAADDVSTPGGFARWVRRLHDGSDRATYRWIVEEGDVLGAIALRHGADSIVPELGHVGYGVRPSARGRGLATWALETVLDLAGERGLDRVLVVCAADNAASVRVIEHCGGQLEGIRDTRLGPARRYWLDVPHESTTEITDE